MSWSVFGLILPASSSCKKIYNLVPHYINTKIIEMGGGNLITIVFTSDAISEVSKYNFDTEKLMVYPKHTIFTNNKDE